MIRYEVGDMFQANTDCLINTVNCEGYMGKGIAYQFKIRFPENNKDYIKACKNGSLHIGTIHSFRENGKTIINFPTKDKWREPSKISFIEQGLDMFINTLPDLKVKSIAIPPLGCGNGGLVWSDVKQVIEKKLKDIGNEYDFIIYEPSREYKQKASVAPKLSVSSLILLQIKMKVIRCTKLRLQKTAFLMDIFSKENYFEFRKYKYGPYAHSIDVIAKSIGEYQSFYSLTDTKKTYDMLYSVICSDKTDSVLQRLKPSLVKATEFVNHINNDEDLEGITTVLYLIQNGTHTSEMELINDFHDWSEDKKVRFSAKRIDSIIAYLSDIGIIEMDILGNYLLSEFF